MDPLLSYHWPGNVRELENAAERFLVLCHGEHLTPKSIRDILQHALFPTYSLSTGIEDRKNVFISEEELIDQALLKTEGNKEKAADLLGISRTTLWRKMKKS